MLSYALAIAVAVSSLILFSTAFLMSDIHRQDDFFWSGVGLIYALVLWFCARNITGAVLLGQAAAVAVLISSNWQTLKLRKAIAHPEKADELNNFSVLKAVNDLLSRRKSQTPSVVNDSTPDKLTEQKVEIPEQASPEKVAKQPNNQATTDAENSSDSLEKQANADKNKQSGLFGKLFGRKKQVAITDTKLDEVLEEKEQEQATADQISDTTPITEEKPIALAENLDQVTSVDSETVAQVNTQQPTEGQEVKLDKQTEIIAEQPENQSDTNTSEVTSSNASPATKENQLEEKTANNNPDKPSTIDESEINLVAEDNPAEIKENIETIEPKAKESSLDSLETVEVAEVLEAVPEDISLNKNDDQSNIIEVTTTEINIATESTKTDDQHDHNSDSEESKNS